MNKKNLFYLLIVFGFLASCATTRITAFKDPNFTDKTFHRILVVAPFSDMEYRDVTEKQFVYWLSFYSAEAVSSIRIMPPTRTYSEEEYNKAIMKNNIEAVLVVTITDAYTSEVFVPGSTRTNARATLMGNYIDFSSRTTQSPGYFISKPRAKFEMRLFDVASGNTAWVASSLTKGGALADFETLINSLSWNAASQLRHDGMLRKK